MKYNRSLCFKIVNVANAFAATLRNAGVKSDLDCIENPHALISALYYGQSM